MSLDTVIVCNHEINIIALSIGYSRAIVILVLSFMHKTINGINDNSLLFYN